MIQVTITVLNWTLDRIIYNFSPSREANLFHWRGVLMIQVTTRMNCFRYLKLMSPINAAICTTTYLERQKCYGPDKKILFKKTLFDLEVKDQGPTKVITVQYSTHRLMIMHPHTKYHWPISKDKNVMARTRKYYLKNNYLTLRW